MTQVADDNATEYQSYSLWPGESMKAEIISFTFDMPVLLVQTIHTG